MRLLLYKFLLPLLLFFCLPAYHAAAQDTTVAGSTVNTAPTDAQWQQLQHDDAFGYAQEKENSKQPAPKPVKNNFFEELIKAIVSFFSSTVGAAILYTDLFLVIAYVAYRILIGEKSFLFARKKTVLTEDTATQTEEELLGIDWEQRLRAAYDKADLRLAIRYSYMWLLQLMQERELIQYRNDKTNNDYYHELSETQYKQPFRQLTREYEFAWYGQYPVSGAAYQQYMQLFDAIKTRLN